MATYYWVGGSGTWDNASTTNWATVSGGAGGFGPPLVADTVNFDANSGTAAVVTVASTAKAGSTVINKADINLSLSGNVSLTTTGSITLTTGNISLGTNTLTIGAFVSNNSNTRSVSFGAGSKIVLATTTGAPIQCNTLTGFSFTGTSRVELTSTTGTATIRNGNTAGGSATSAMSFYFLGGGGTIDFAGHATTLDYTGFTGTATNQARTLYGDLIGSVGMTWTAGANTTTFASTSGTQVITTSGKTFDFPIAFNGVGGTFAFQDALTQGSTRAFTITNGTVQLKDGVTSTVGAFATSGSNQKFLMSTLAESQATLSQASGTVSANNLTIKDINATGGAVWNSYVDQGNIDAGNNDGWDFGISPVLGAYEYTYSLRSFTQPRRF